MLHLPSNNQFRREDSQCRIREHMDLVSSRMRVVSWNSHARRTRTMEHVNDLRRELDEAMDEHTSAETDMRKENLKLEAEVIVTNTIQLFMN